MNETSKSGSNLLLDSLSAVTRQALNPDLRQRTIAHGEVVVEPGRPAHNVYFPLTCVFSVISKGTESQAAENVAVGHESLIAFPMFDDTNATTTVVAQAEGQALEMSKPAFLRHMAREDFMLAVLRHWETLFVVSWQSTVCQAFHTAEQRLARWLLLMHDRVEGDDLHLTQDFLASMMGVQRPTVTIAARILQAAELINYRYGRIHIRDRNGLEASACECYELVDRAAVTIRPRASNP